MNNISFKEKRRQLGLTQIELASRLGVSRQTIVNYENGDVIPESKSKLLDIVFSQTTTEATNNIEVSHINAETSSIMFVPLVTQYAYAGYLGGFADAEFVETLPKIPFILDKEYKGEYLCFEVKGDSMENGTDESLNEGDILLCRNIKPDYWKSKLHINKWDFVIVTKTDGILAKRIINHDVEKGVITIHSLNDFYDDKQINLRNVSQIFNIIDVQKKRKRR